MSGFEIFLDIVVIGISFLLVGRDRCNATPQPAPEQQDEAPPTPPIDAEAVVREAIATMPTSLVAGSVRLAEVLTFPSKPAPVVAAPAKRKRGRPKGSGKKKLAPAVAG